METQKNEKCTPKKRPLSVILICKNADSTLARTLESIALYASQIVAVINDCTDNTRSVLESYQATIIEQPWAGMTAQKNTALNYANQPWILNLDADEAPTAELVKEILKAIDANHLAVAAYRIPRLSFFLNQWIRHGDWYPDYVVRLFRREKGYFVGDSAHEKVSVEGLVQTFKHPLQHYSFVSMNHQLSKVSFFSDGFLETLLAKKARFSALRTISRGFWRFFRAYVLRRGFLDGYAGFYIAFFQCFSTIYRYSRLYEHEEKEKAVE